MTLPKLIRENRFCVIDCETTGVNIHRDELVQFAVVQVDYGRPSIRASSLVRPHRRIADGAIDAHGLTWQMLEHAPELTEVWPDFRTLIGSRTLVGFNVAFDHRILSRQLAENGVQFDAGAVDVLTWERRFAGKGGKHNLLACIERWELPVLEAHDALADCRMTWNLFVTLAARFPELGELALEEALAIKPAPPLSADVKL